MERYIMIAALMACSAAALPGTQALVASQGAGLSAQGRRLLCGLLDGPNCGDGCPYLSSCQNGFCAGLVSGSIPCGANAGSSSSSSGNTGTTSSSGSSAGSGSGSGSSNYVTQDPPSPPPPAPVESPPPPPPVESPPPPPPAMTCPTGLNVWSKGDDIESACYDDCTARGNQVCIFSHNTVQVLDTICAASVYVEYLTPFCAGGLYAEGKEYCNAQCIDPCANIPQAACLLSTVDFYCQDTCLSAGVTLVDGVAKLTSDLANSASNAVSNAGQSAYNCVTNAFGGGCGK